MSGQIDLTDDISSRDVIILPIKYKFGCIYFFKMDVT